MRDSFKAPAAPRSRHSAEPPLVERKADPQRERRLRVIKHGDAELGSFALVLPANEECALAGDHR